MLTAARSESDWRPSTLCSNGTNSAHGTNSLMRQKLMVKCFMTHSYQTHTHTYLNLQTFRQWLQTYITLSIASVLKHDQSQRSGFHSRYQELFATQDTTALGNYNNDSLRQDSADVRKTCFNSHTSRTFRMLAHYLIVILLVTKRDPPLINFKQA